MFRSRLRDRVLNYDERLEQLRGHARDGSKTSLILDGFCDSATRSIAALREKIDPHQLDKAIKLLAEAETIYLVGLRRSFPISSYMSLCLRQAGVKNMLIDAVGGLAAEDVGFATPQDRILAISFTPYASETISLAQRAAARNVPVIAITDSPFSPLASVARLWFEIQRPILKAFAPCRPPCPWP